MVEVTTVQIGSVVDGMVLGEYGVVLRRRPAPDEVPTILRFFRYFLWAEGVRPEGEVQYVYMTSPPGAVTPCGVYCLGWKRWSK